VDVVNSGKEPPVGGDRLIRYIIPYRATLPLLICRRKLRITNRKMHHKKSMIFEIMSDFYVLKTSKTLTGEKKEEDPHRIFQK
jgi:hypothetical protein